MITAVIRGMAREDIDLDDFKLVEGKMLDIGTKMEGFIEIKEYVSEDGENLMLVAFDTRENMIKWRDHPSHKKTQQRGRDKYFNTYDVKICEVMHHYSWSREEDRLVHQVS